MAFPSSTASQLPTSSPVSPAYIQLTQMVSSPAEAEVVAVAHMAAVVVVVEMAAAEAEAAVANGAAAAAVANNGSW